MISRVQVGHQIVGHDAQVLAQLEEHPAIAPEHAHLGVGRDDRKQLARDQLDQRGLARAVRPEDRDVLPCRNREREPIEDTRLVTVDRQVAKLQQHLHAVSFLNLCLPRFHAGSS